MTTASIEKALDDKAQSVADTLALPITYGEPGFAVPEGIYLDCRQAAGEPLRRYLDGTAPHERLYTLQLTVTAREGWPVGELRTAASNVAAEFAVDEAVPAAAPLAKVIAAPHVDALITDKGKSLRQIRIRFRAFK